MIYKIWNRILLIILFITVRLIWGKSGKVKDFKEELKPKLKELWKFLKFF